jgi:hypothetical protein
MRANQFRFQPTVITQWLEVYHAQARCGLQTEVVKHQPNKIELEVFYRL